ncbi:MAG: hypothetical protein HOP29_16410 [Phycisphaerales bacterium]|nr:hypothetical protein [Phycisphaerales bacterium]
MSLCSVRPGQRVRITQRIDRRAGDWTTEIEGVIRSIEPRATGSWFAHGKNDRYWLLRIELQKDDGEITSMILDHLTGVTVLDAANATV